MHTHTHTHTHAVVPKTGTHITESIWSVVSVELSTNFLLQGKADERASHLLHTAQSDSASQIHNSPHTAFWGVAIETLLGRSGQKMRGDERGYFPLHLPPTTFCPQSDCIIFLFFASSTHTRAHHDRTQIRRSQLGLTMIICVPEPFIKIMAKSTSPNDFTSQAECWNALPPILLSNQVMWDV